MSRNINADALIEKIKRCLDTEWDGGTSWKRAYSEFIDMIDEQPTADVVPMKFHERCMELEIKKRANMVERKQGKNISEDGFLCSVCTFGDFGGFHGYEPNFCPNCGAEMEHD